MYLFHFRVLLLFLVYAGTILVRHFPLVYVVHFTDIPVDVRGCLVTSYICIVIGSMVSS